MKKILLISFLSLMSAVLFAATITVTPADYESAYNSAADGDILLLDAGTYANALEFPVGKAITLKKLETAASTPILTFSWTITVPPTTGSSLVLDGLEINLNGDYYMIFAEASVVDKFTIKNCTIANINRCLIRATNPGTIMNELTLENNIIKDCGANGYCLVWFREILYNYTVINNTMYNYGGEGFFLGQNNDQTHAFVFNMHNNTIYKSGKDGLADYGWCSILVNYGAESTYNISNNIFNKPFTTADQRVTIVVPAGSGTVTCSNNLAIDYPNFATPPGAGWTYTDNTESTTNCFRDPDNNDFTLDANFSYKGTDGNYIGAPRWWPGQGSAVNDFKELQVKAYSNNGFINIELPDKINCIEIYTINGSKMLSMNIEANKAQIDASIYNKGIYILKVASQNKIAIQKINL